MVRKATSQITIRDGSRFIDVYIGSRPEPIGKIIYDRTPGLQQSAFEYTESWLNDPRRFAVEPALPLVSGRQFRRSSRGGTPLFGSFADVGPDGWGLLLIARAMRNQHNPIDPRRLSPLDFMLLVSDEYRCGALRFADESGKMVGLDRSAVPYSIKIADLVDAADAVERDAETAAQLELLMDRSTALGGMRPKASATSEFGALAIGKFPKIGDVRSIPKGEALTLQLASLCGINTTDFAMMEVLGRPVIMLKRFDRTAEGKRLHYISAKTMLEDAGPLESSFVDLAEIIRKHGQDVPAELRELYKRMVLDILVSNFDNHWGNTGFLHAGGNFWKLSPAFDINPFPDQQRHLASWISGDLGSDASIESCLAVAPRFGLTNAEAKELIGGMAAVVSTWREVAMSKKVGMTQSEVEMFAGAFEHLEMKLALKWQTPRASDVKRMM